jgi:hypothetical protein
MRPPRMTTRRWFLAIAVVAIALWPANRLAKRRAYFLARAAHHRHMAIEISRDKRSRDPADCPNTFISMLHDRMALEYERAARAPWLPDPGLHLCGKISSLMRRR